MLGFGGDAGAAAANAVFQHGVASGDPLADRVVLWTRASPIGTRSATVVDYVVATDPALSVVVAKGSTKTNVLRDFTVKVDVAGLQPNTTYYYRFTADGAQSPTGRTKTLPVGAARQLRMAVVSCSNFACGYFNVYQRIAERADLDMVVHLGDYICEYATGQYGTARPCEPANEIVTLADYRARHAQYKRDESSQAMHRQHPLIAIWDDHETANNSWVDGAENHTPETEGAWAARVAAALQAYYEWMPVRVVDPAMPRRNQRRYAFGNLVDLIMLEERLGGRSEQLGTNIGNASGYFTQTGAYADPTRQLLGANEQAWLSAKLRSSTAKWEFLGQGVMFAQLEVVAAPNAAGGDVFLNSDQWDGYQPARDRVYSVIKGGVGCRPDARPEQPEHLDRRRRPGDRRGFAGGRVRRHVGLVTRRERPERRSRQQPQAGQPALQVHQPQPARLHADRRRPEPLRLRVVAHRHRGEPWQHRDLRGRLRGARRQQSARGLGANAVAPEPTAARAVSPRRCRHTKGTLMTRQLLARTITAVGIVCAALGAHAADFSVSGNLVYNTDVARFTFRLDTVAVDVGIWTCSWLAGVNFDPTAAVWAKVGGSYSLLAAVDDDDTIGAGQGAFDAGLHFASLAAGDYLVTIAAAPNYANGPLLQAGFAFDGGTPITLAAWMQPSANPNFPDQKGGFWNVNLTNVSSVTTVPEPSTWALLGAGLALCSVAARRRRTGASSATA